MGVNLERDGKGNRGKSNMVSNTPRPKPVFANGSLLPVSNNRALVIGQPISKPGMASTTTSKAHPGPNKAAEVDYHVLVRGSNLDNKITRVTVSNPVVGSECLDLRPVRPKPDIFGNPLTPHPPSSNDPNAMDIISSPNVKVNGIPVEDGVDDIEEFSHDMRSIGEVVPHSL